MKSTNMTHLLHLRVKWVVSWYQTSLMHLSDIKSETHIQIFCNIPHRDIIYQIWYPYSYFDIWYSYPISCYLNTKQALSILVWRRLACCKISDMAIDILVQLFEFVVGLWVSWYACQMFIFLINNFRNDGWWFVNWFLIPVQFL